MAVYGGIPREFPQTAPVAEIVAAFQAVQASEHGAHVHIVTDCNTVVAGIKNGEKQVRKGLRHAALWKRMWVIVRNFELSLQVSKTKAHRTRAQALAEDDEENYLGNEHADALAGKGAKLLAATEADFNEELTAQGRETHLIRTVLKNATTGWKAREWQRKDKAATAMQGDKVRCELASNCFKGREHMWWCKHCGRGIMRHKETKAKPPVCTGTPRIATIGTLHQHKIGLWLVNTGRWKGRQLWGCTICGSTGVAHAKGLRRKCEGSAHGHRQWVKHQMQQGKHPNGKDTITRIGVYKSGIIANPNCREEIKRIDTNPWEFGERVAEAFWDSLEGKPETEVPASQESCAGMPEVGVDPEEGFWDEQRDSQGGYPDEGQEPWPDGPC